MKIGIIGLGAMGWPIARNLLRAGHSVVGHNRTVARAEELKSAGLIVGQSLSEACQADAVITLLADDSALESVVFHSQEFLPCFTAGQVHISMGTVGLVMVQRLTAAHAQAGGQLVSAPVFGRPDAAAAASLSVVAAGPEPALNRVSSVFNAIAKRVFVVGEEPYKANVVKLCGNALLLSAIAGLAESMAFARRQSVAPALLLEILTNTILSVPFYETYGSLMVEQRFLPAGFRLRLGLKDIELLLQEAARAGMELPWLPLLDTSCKGELQRA